MCVWTDARAGSEGESRPHGGSGHFSGALLPGFLRAVTLLHPVLSLGLVHLSVLPCASACLGAKMDSSEEADGYADATYSEVMPLLF